MPWMDAADAALSSQGSSRILNDIKAPIVGESEISFAGKQAGNLGRRLLVSDNSA